MSEPRKTVFLREPEQGINCLYELIKWVRPFLQAGREFTVRIGPIEKRRIQEEKYHAMAGDIAKQIEHIGRRWHADDMKRLLVDEFAEVMRLAGTPLHHDSRVAPSLDGKRIVQLGIQTREFYVKEATEFIEWLYSFGAERGVIWSEPKPQEPDR